MKGQCFKSFWMSGSLKFLPIMRFASNTVFVGFDVICAFAASPIRRCVSVNATTEGVVRFPRSLGIISTFPSFHTPTQEYLQTKFNKARKYVVPRSIPIQYPARY